MVSASSSSRNNAGGISNHAKPTDRCEVASHQSPWNEYDPPRRHQSQTTQRAVVLAQSRVTPPAGGIPPRPVDRSSLAPQNPRPNTQACKPACARSTSLEAILRLRRDRRPPIFAKHPASAHDPPGQPDPPKTQVPRPKTQDPRPKTTIHVRTRPHPNANETFSLARTFISITGASLLQQCAGICQAPGETRGRPGCWT